MSIEKFLSNVVVDGTISKVGGTSTQFLKADGSVDTNVVPYTGAITNTDLGEYQLKAGQLEFDQTPTGIAGVAKLRWNDTDGTLDLGLKGGNVTLQLGQEQIVRVVNKTASNLLEVDYQVVYISGAQGNRLKVNLALANSDLTTSGTIGIVTENINVNQEGFITSNGLVRGINTTGSLQGETWIDGDILYVSPTIAGKLTNIKPVAPQHLVSVGVCVSAHITQGSIFVKVDNGYELEELHNVLINTPLNNDALIYETSTGLWKNKTISTALGYTPENVANKSDSYTASSSTTYASTKALVDGLATKIGGTGTTNYIPKWTGSGTQGNSLIYDNGTNVGIGTSTPLGKFDIRGGTSQFTHTTNDWISGSLGSYLFVAAGANSGNTFYQIGAQTGGGSAWGNLVLQSGGGNVGIGTTTPNAKLDVNGNTTVTGSLINGVAGNVALGLYSHAEGYNTKALGDISHAEGVSTLASGYGSHAEGNNTIAGSQKAYLATSFIDGVATLSSTYGNITSSFNIGQNLLADDNNYNGDFGIAHSKITAKAWNGTSTVITVQDLINTGDYAIVGDTSNVSSWAGDYEFQSNSTHTEGYGTWAIGNFCHAEGQVTRAFEYSSHAEGIGTVAYYGAHAEGLSTSALGQFSHAEGYSTTSSGNYSHAEGYNTVALGQYQHVQGQFNISSSAQSAFIVGNGTSNANRSNLIFASGSQVRITGSLTVTSNVTALGFYNSSDARLKDITSRQGDTVYYTWKDGRDSKQHIGYIAQEVQQTYPDQVHAGEDGYLSVNYIEVLVAKIQALENRLKKLENGI